LKKGDAATLKALALPPCPGSCAVLSAPGSAR
jgi:hypothetical protein